RDLDPQTADLDHRPGIRGGHPSSASMRATARATPSVTKFVPTANRAIQTAGTITAQGLSVKPWRFSLIISPQSAFGGWMPKPRKLTPATRAIDHVRRRP